MAVFEKVLDACTENYGCLVIDNTVNTNAISEQVFFYRADDHKEFLLCDERFWVKDNDKKNKPPVNPQVVKNINVKKVKF